MPLTVKQIDNANPKNKPYKLFDTDGLYLYVLQLGKKVWRFKYKFNGKECLNTFDKYLNINLEEARQRRNEYLSMIAKGINSAQAKNIS